MATHREPWAAAIAVRLLRELYAPVARDSDALEEMPESAPGEGYLAFRLRMLATSGSPMPWVLRAHRRRRRMPEHFRYFYPWACPRLESPGSASRAAATQMAPATWSLGSGPAQPR
jgi:hypothetical protein